MYVDKLYAKDYVSVGNVAEAAIFFSELHHSDNKIINIASGKNVSANEIASILEKETGCTINWHTKTTAQESFPVTDNKTFRQSIPELKIDDVIEDMKEMIFQFKESINKGDCVKICAVVVTFNRKQLLVRSLNSIISQRNAVLNKIIIIDNASTDGTEIYLHEKGMFVNNNIEIEYVRLQSNLGGAGGFNKGLSIAFDQQYDYCWVMDDDGYQMKTASIKC